MRKVIATMEKVSNEIPKAVDERAIERDDKRQQEVESLMAQMSWQSMIKFIRGDEEIVADIRGRLADDQSYLMKFKEECGCNIRNMLWCRAILEVRWRKFQRLDLADMRDGDEQRLMQCNPSRAYWNEYKVTMQANDAFTREDIALIAWAMDPARIVGGPVNADRIISYWELRLKEESERLNREARGLNEGASNYEDPDAKPAQELDSEYLHDIIAYLENMRPVYGGNYALSLALRVSIAGIRQVQSMLGVSCPDQNQR